ncbi:MAG: hypothetical protein EZS28_006810 [Streblomastix strix]|uniref:EGF-like domain-containing protein n=1 Tax=Streblomastix strix TaxID=222440 RepID=A0A5J4WRB2_9EUKA|nr:MAG: hypothetical protein EZS28_006810 [Streblomastix strix]
MLLLLALALISLGQSFQFGNLFQFARSKQIHISNPIIQTTPLLVGNQTSINKLYSSSNDELTTCDSEHYFPCLCSGDGQDPPNCYCSGTDNEPTTCTPQLCVSNEQTYPCFCTGHTGIDTYGCLCNGQPNQPSYCIYPSCVSNQQTYPCICTGETDIDTTDCICSDINQLAQHCTLLDCTINQDSKPCLCTGKSSKDIIGCICSGKERAESECQLLSCLDPDQLSPGVCLCDAVNHPEGCTPVACESTEQEYQCLCERQGNDKDGCICNEFDWDNYLPLPAGCTLIDCESEDQQTPCLCTGQRAKDPFNCFCSGNELDRQYCVPQECESSEQSYQCICTGNDEKDTPFCVCSSENHPDLCTCQDEYYSGCICSDNWQNPPECTRLCKEGEFPADEPNPEIFNCECLEGDHTCQAGQKFCNEGTYTQPKPLGCKPYQCMQYPHLCRGDPSTDRPECICIGPVDGENGPCTPTYCTDQLDETECLCTGNPDNDSPHCVCTGADNEPATCTVKINENPNGKDLCQCSGNELADDVNCFCSEQNQDLSLCTPRLCESGSQEYPCLCRGNPNYDRPDCICNNVGEERNSDYYTCLVIDCRDPDIMYPGRCGCTPENHPLGCEPTHTCHDPEQGYPCYCFEPELNTPDCFCSGDQYHPDGCLCSNSNSDYYGCKCNDMFENEGCVPTCKEEQFPDPDELFDQYNCFCDNKDQTCIDGPTPCTVETYDPEYPQTCKLISCTDKEQNYPCLCTGNEDLDTPECICKEGNNDKVESGSCFCDPNWDNDHHPMGCLCAEEGDSYCICNDRESDLTKCFTICNENELPYIEYPYLGCACNYSDYRCMEKTNYCTEGDYIHPGPKGCYPGYCNGIHDQTPCLCQPEPIENPDECYTICEEGQFPGFDKCMCRHGDEICQAGRQPCSGITNDDPTPKGCYPLLCSARNQELPCICTGHLNRDRPDCICIGSTDEDTGLCAPAYCDGSAGTCICGEQNTEGCVCDGNIDQPDTCTPAIPTGKNPGVCTGNQDLDNCRCPDPATGHQFPENYCTCSEDGQPEGCNCPTEPQQLVGIRTDACPCNGDDDPRRGTTCEVTRVCSINDLVQTPCLCSEAFANGNCTCTEDYYDDQQCICDQSEKSGVYNLTTCLATKTCTGGDFDNPTPTGCTPPDCTSASQIYKCNCKPDLDPIGCNCPTEPQQGHASVLIPTNYYGSVGQLHPSGYPSSEHVQQSSGN